MNMDMSTELILKGLFEEKINKHFGSYCQISQRMESSKEFNYTYKILDLSTYMMIRACIKYDIINRWHHACSIAIIRDGVFIHSCELRNIGHYLDPELIDIAMEKIKDAICSKSDFILK